MRLIPSDPDIETIANRIRNGDLDLQPNFQRGEVWTTSKKQKLIDSVLRDWHVPPIHVIKGANGGADVVLDGQQRLAAIRDFVGGAIRVNGKIEPFDEKLAALDGMYFDDLSPEWKRKVRGFAIRQFTIVDYQPSEPSELFYRLNQPTALTAAEQRNSFFGKPREQIKALVEKMELLGLSKDFLGFSNARMSYDDALARVCVALESGLSTKTGANLLADRYRSGDPFSDEALRRVEQSIELLSKIKDTRLAQCRLNKASLFSWLVFFCRYLGVNPTVDSARWASFFYKFESDRVLYSLGEIGRGYDEEVRAALFAIYNDRVTSRVADVSSVVLRDIAMWGIYAWDPEKDIESFTGLLRKLRIVLEQSNSTDASRITERYLIQNFLSENSEKWEQIK
ncbi:hypothetical protein hmeg3_13670 [Herbaspirillum sp. meg3]|uniref:DUF262 domain-containing protein n=1 Tax=Herbaspirillum sp. meg3 TaxID=2025949 RepID=UPI000B995207|nr:DUF262 domain-containing protein [Herbaspirillum sp. meg3]ASU39231.1 hypothetical protein hmeg3_13670 [Herbaspirillum sp. meg3]